VSDSRPVPEQRVTDAARVIYEWCGPGSVCPWERVDSRSKERWCQVAAAATRDLRRVCEWTSSQSSTGSHS
jgi:hypothetical protein